jgi:hypothetical protein
MWLRRHTRSPREAGTPRQPPPMDGVHRGPATAKNRGSSLLAPAQHLEELGWGLIDWRGLPPLVPVQLLRVADRIAREGHAVAFTGQEYQAGPELTVDGHLTVTRYLSRQPGPADTPGAARDLLAAVLADVTGGAARIAVVCDQPDLSEEDASQVITGLRHRPSPAGTAGVDIYGYGWTVHE